MSLADGNFKHDEASNMRDSVVGCTDFFEPMWWREPPTANAKAPPRRFEQDLEVVQVASNDLDDALQPDDDEIVIMRHFLDEPNPEVTNQL